MYVKYFINAHKDNVNTYSDCKSNYKQKNETLNVKYICVLVYIYDDKVEANNIIKVSFFAFG